MSISRRKPITAISAHVTTASSGRAIGLADGERHPLPPPPSKCGTTSGHSLKKPKGLAAGKPRGGAPIGNQNAFKHGRYSGEFRARRKVTRTLVAQTNTVIAQMKVYRALRRAFGLVHYTTRHTIVTDHPNGRCSVTVKTVRFGYDGRKMTPVQVAVAKKMEPVWQSLLTKPVSALHETLASILPAATQAARQRLQAERP